MNDFDVVYTAQNLSADTWIERTVYNAKRRPLYTVITADGGIRDLCRGLGARVFTPDWLENETGQARANSAQNQKSGAAGPSRELGDRLDRDSHDRLTQLRDQLGNGKDKNEQ